MPRYCVNDKKKFCLLCGIFTPEKCRGALTDNVKANYESYFGFKVPINSWTPDTICNTCVKTLNSWKRGDDRKFPFKHPMKWLRTTDHDNCYFCKS